MSRSPSGSRFGAIRLLAVLSAVLTLAALTIPLLGSSASAETASPVVTVTATAGGNTYAVGATIPNLTDGQDIHIHVDAQSPPNAVASSIFAIEGRECANNAINNSFDFTPTQGGNCANVALGAGSLHPNVGIAAPNTTGDMDFNAGVGTTTFTDGDLNSHTITCSAATTCKLVVALGVPGGTQYVSFLLGFVASAPGDPVASSVPGDGAGTVNWTPPASTGGSPIDHYLVTETSPVAGSPVTVAAPATTLHVAGLTNFTAYTYKVQAVNGSSLTSPGTAPTASTTFTPVPATAPVITGAVAGPASVALTWSAASGGPTSYTVSSNPVVAPPAACVATTALTCNFTGLTNGTAYTFVVTANYTGGTLPSAASAPVTPTSNFGSVTQTVTVTRPADVFAIGEACSGPPYPDTPPLAADKPWLTNTNAVENCALPLGTAVYQTGGFYQATGIVKDVEVRDTRVADTGWHVDATMTNFTNGANSFLACNFGYAPAASGEGALAPYTQTVTAAPAVTAGCPGGGYVAGSTGHTVATGAAGHGLGDSLINGNVTVDIPASVPAGAYTAVLTFTLFTN